MKSPAFRKLQLGWLAAAGLAAQLTAAPAATFSLSADFSDTDNRTNSTWSYRMDNSDKPLPSFPLLTSNHRDANALWGSDFPTPPKMWSDATGYWGIGKNVSGRELFSSRNGTRWAPGEVLFHPKGGDSPSRLVIGWTAPSNLVINLDYVLGRAAEQGDGIGYEIIQRSGGVDREVVSLENLAGGVSNSLTGIAVAHGDQLFFRFDTRGDPGGDISRAEIKITGTPYPASSTVAIQPAGGNLSEGSDFTLSTTPPPEGGHTFQWRKAGNPIPGATNASHRIRGVKTTDAGAYSVAIGSTPSGIAMLQVTPRKPLPERFPSPVPRQVFASTLAEQEQQLQTNSLMQRFARSRQKLAADPYRPAYHFVSPESQMNDPNGLCFWQGRWHLFYQAYPPDEFPEPRDIAKRRQHWGHAVSEDLVHWRDLPYAIYPGIEKMCFSGGTVVEAHQVVAFYPGISAGQMVAIAKDPLLLNWEKLEGNPVIPNRAGDSCIWKEDETYLGLIGRSLWTSTNLLNWVAHGEFYTGAEGSCPNFLPLGNKHILLGFSHSAGGLYLLGDYDRSQRRFKSSAQGRFNHGTVSPGGVHAPSAAADGNGGLINILNLNDGRPSDDWDQIMSLAQRLTLGPDNRLHIEPVPATATLRGNRQHVGETRLPANREIVLDDIRGNTLELEVEIDPQLSRWVQLNVLRSPDAEEQTAITFYNFDRKLSIWYDTQGVVCLDGSRSSNLPDVWLRPPERTGLERKPGELLKLRVFVDRSVVEVFVNGRQYLAQRVYPGRPDSIGVSVRAQGQDALLKKLDAWQLRAIWP